MTAQDQEHEMADDKRLSELYRATRREMPPARLDQEILAQAERFARSRRRRWLIPLSTAAVILLGTSLTLTLVQPPVTTSMPELEQDVQSYDAMEAPKMAPSAPLKRRQKLAPETSKPELELQSVAPSSSGINMDRAAPMEESLLQRQMGALRSAPGMQEDKVQEAPQASATSWIERMNALLQAGERERLIETLADFRKAYPAYPLPDELAEIEKQQ